MQSPKELLAAFSSTRQGRTPREAVELLIAYGFTLFDQKQGIAIYQHPVDKKVLIEVGISGHNLPAPQYSSIKRACEGVTPPERETATIKLAHTIHELTLDGVPELIAFVMFQAGEKKEIQESTIALAREKLAPFVEAHKKMLARMAENYGVRIIRDAGNNQIILEGLERQLVWNKKYKEDGEVATPEDIQAFAQEFLTKVEEVALSRLEKLETYMTMGAEKEKETDTHIYVKDPKFDGKTLKLEKLGKVSLTSKAEHYLEEAIAASTALLLKLHRSVLEDKKEVLKL